MKMFTADFNDFDTNNTNKPIGTRAKRALFYFLQITANDPGTFK